MTYVLENKATKTVRDKDDGLASINSPITHHGLQKLTSEAIEAGCGLVA